MSRYRLGGKTPGQTDLAGIYRRKLLTVYLVTRYWFCYTTGLKDAIQFGLNIKMQTNVGLVFIKNVIPIVYIR